MKKASLKKAVSLLLALVLAVTLLVPSFAAGKSKQNPVLVVTGFAEYPLVNTSTGESAFPPSTDAILNTVKGVLPSLLTLLGSGQTKADYDAFCDAALPVVNELFEPIVCNPDGSVKHTEVGLAYQYPESAAEYGKNSEAYAQAFDKSLLRSVAKTVGADKTYVYGLDWRLSPLEIADELNEWIQHIKSVHNCDKVSLAGISMGGVMVSAYLAEYGTADISNITMISSAFTGLSYIGALFNGGIAIDEQGLYNMLNQLVGTEKLSQIIGSTGLVKQIIAMIDDLYAAEQDRLFTECLIPAFGYNPGIWSFVPADDYEAAKAFMFARMASTDAEKAALEAKIDAYHAIQVNAKANLEAAKKTGVNVAIISNYNSQMPPISTASAQTGDQVIETVHTSAFATCADQGNQLPEGTKGKYVSPDRMIDASTCWFPNETWFIKNMQHVGFDDTQNQCDLYTWLMTADKQVTVRSNADFPQFLLYNTETKVLSPLSLLRGDVNFDGRVNLIDARMVLRHVRTLTTLSALAKEAADMDGNARLTHTDAQLLLDTYAGVTAAPKDKTFSADSIKDAVSDAVNGGNSDGGNPLDGIKDKIGNALGAVKDMFGTKSVPQDKLAQLADLIPKATRPAESDAEAAETCTDHAEELHESFPAAEA